jgi:hypothetical protein
MSEAILTEYFFFLDKKQELEALSWDLFDYVSYAENMRNLRGVEGQLRKLCMEHSRKLGGWKNNL